jgi:hypothetical protein
MISLKYCWRKTTINQPTKNEELSEKMHNFVWCNLYETKNDKTVHMAYKGPNPVLPNRWHKIYTMYRSIAKSLMFYKYLRYVYK